MGYMVLIDRSHGKPPSQIACTNATEAIDLARRLLKSGRRVAGIAKAPGALGSPLDLVRAPAS